MLVLGDSATLCEVDQDYRPFKHGLESRSREWWDYANASHDMSRKTLWFVSGTVKTTPTWRTLVFRNHEAASSFAVSGEKPALGGGRFRFESVTRASTSPFEQLPQDNNQLSEGSQDHDQTIFAKLIGIKKRFDPLALMRRRKSLVTPTESSSANVGSNTRDQEKSSPSIYREDVLGFSIEGSSMMTERQGQLSEVCIRLAEYRIVSLQLSCRTIR
jgi:hypothetical protein